MKNQLRSSLQSSCVHQQNGFSRVIFLWSPFSLLVCANLRPVFRLCDRRDLPLKAWHVQVYDSSLEIPELFPF